MNPENRKRIQEAAGKAGDELKDKLPSLPDFPNRNSYAHVWREIKEAFGKTYKECTDEQVDEILAVIERTRLNPK